VSRFGWMGGSWVVLKGAQASKNTRRKSGTKIPVHARAHARSVSDWPENRSDPFETGRAAFVSVPERTCHRKPGISNHDDARIYQHATAISGPPPATTTLKTRPCCTVFLMEIRAVLLVPASCCVCFTSTQGLPHARHDAAFAGVSHGRARGAHTAGGPSPTTSPPTRCTFIAPRRQTMAHRTTSTAADAAPRHAPAGHHTRARSPSSCPLPRGTRSLTASTCPADLTALYTSTPPAVLPHRAQHEVATPSGKQTEGNQQEKRTHQGCCLSCRDRGNVPSHPVQRQPVVAAAGGCCS
jgi:hypothetical protein